MGERRELVSQLEMPEYLKLCMDGTLERFKTDSEGFPEAFRRFKDEQSLKGFI